MGVVRTALLMGFLLWFSLLANGLNLWPMPASVGYGSGILYLSNNFQLRTEGSKYSDDSRILSDAFLRMVDLVRVAHVIDGIVPSSAVLDGLHVRIFSEDDKLNFGTDETYKLSIPASGEETYAQIEVDCTALTNLTLLFVDVAFIMSFCDGS
ncbi:Beta-hexosaminidase 3 [Dendrobium catenatum]|uniref:Beta-hexosaminidase 3 n=1 Tax=Dendrobium catenatum TaxID=906689 RepID=A0A2I0X9U4_9ASPA|nr:Beta-hexosaminidase 3 [Dendrobium catenatum]